MLRKIKNKISNYFFKQFELYQKKKLNQEYQDIVFKFKKTGKGFLIGKDYSIFNPQYMEFGNNFWTKERFRIEAIDCYNGQKFSPSIKIGNNVTFNTDIHIGCINLIKIGDNCMFASRIFITDHNHGDTEKRSLSIPPGLRPLISKGPVVIQNNVWVGEGVAILAGVTIGENSIISANAVVTKNVPQNAVVGGIPAKVIKIMK